MLGRLWRHAWASLYPARRRLSAADLARIEAEVTRAESTHTGEIRVAVETALPLKPLWARVTPRQRALQVFALLGVWDTARNNGVLIYVLLADRSVEIVADRAIAERVSEAEWRDLCAAVVRGFQQRQPAEGCCAAVRGVAEHLARHFAASGDRGNELPNQPVLL